jgi:hypothetical protein
MSRRKETLNEGQESQTNNPRSGLVQRIGIYPVTGCRWIDLALSLPLVAVCGLPCIESANSGLT